MSASKINEVTPVTLCDDPTARALRTGGFRRITDASNVSSPLADAAALNHAIKVIYRVCCLAGSANLLDEIRAELRAEGIPGAIRRHDTATLFDWLVAALSYQGISDQVATEYMARHGRARWHDIDAKVAANPSCPKLQSYWHFHGCRYDKISRTCSEPDHIDGCPLPGHNLRNGRLNQTAYSLYLFVRDIADGDLVGWIDRQFRSFDEPHDAGRPARLRAALIGPLRQVYGVSDKVLTMTLSCILLGRAQRLRNLARGRRQHDRHRHPGAQLSGPHRHPGQVRSRPPVWRSLLPGWRLRRHYCCRGAQRIDARPFNPRFPQPFFRGSSSTRSGGTAPSLASTSATAIGSMIGSLATTSTAKFVVFVIV